MRRSHFIFCKGVELIRLSCSELIDDTQFVDDLRKNQDIYADEDDDGAGPSVPSATTSYEAIRIRYARYSAITRKFQPLKNAADGKVRWSPNFSVSSLSWRNTTLVHRESGNG